YHTILLSFPTRRSSDLHIGLFAPFVGIIKANHIGLVNSFSTAKLQSVDTERTIGRRGIITVSPARHIVENFVGRKSGRVDVVRRSEEHTSELQSRENLV